MNLSVSRVASTHHNHFFGKATNAFEGGILSANVFFPRWESLLTLSNLYCVRDYKSSCLKDAMIKRPT